MLYFTGDTHGELIMRFSYNHNSQLKQLNENDIVFILGDCGRPWFNPELKFYDDYFKPGAEKADMYELNFLNSHPWKTIFICGNHDNYDLIKQMPQIQFNNMICRQMTYINKTYENIYVVDTPQYFECQNKKILIIPGAQSHDIDYILEYDDPKTKTTIKYWEKLERMFGDVYLYRINHFSWWKEEDIDIEKTEQLLKQLPLEIDYILTHDAPAIVLQHWKPMWSPARFNPTEGEKFLEKVRKNISYRQWLHGHLHSYIRLPLYHTLGLYHDIISEEEIEEIIKTDEIENKYTKLLLDQK